MKTNGHAKKRATMGEAVYVNDILLFFFTQVFDRQCTYGKRQGKINNRKEKPKT